MFTVIVTICSLEAAANECLVLTRKQLFDEMAACKEQLAPIMREDLPKYSKIGRDVFGDDELIVNGKCKKVRVNGELGIKQESL